MLNTVAVKEGGQQEMQNLYSTLYVKRHKVVRMINIKTYLATSSCFPLLQASCCLQKINEV